MKSIFIVQCSSGSHDDFGTWIVGVFDLLDKAITCKKKILKEIEIKKNTSCPLEGVKSYNDIEDAKLLSLKEWELFDKWSDDKNEASNFNECWIVKAPLNEVRTDKNWIKLE